MNPYPTTFKTVTGLAICINAYFLYIEGEYRIETIPVKANPKSTAEETTEQKVWDRPPEPPTFSGLAHFLGFESRKALEACEAGGKYAPLLRRARLRIEAEYEKKLHYQSSTGAIFALKNMGWHERTTTADPISTLKIKIDEAGPPPACSEQEVEC